MKLARAKKAELDEQRLAEKERLKAEARFDKLLSMFESVRVESPPAVQKAVRKKPRPVPEPEDEELERPKVKATANPVTKEVFLRFY